MNVCGQIGHVKWFQAEKLNTREEHEFELAANWAEPENQAELVSGLDPGKIKKIKSATLLVQYVKGHPDSSTYVRGKGVLLLTLIVGHPVLFFGSHEAARFFKQLGMENLTSDLKSLPSITLNSNFKVLKSCMPFCQ